MIIMQHMIVYFDLLTFYCHFIFSAELLHAAEILSWCFVFLSRVGCRRTSLSLQQ